MIVEKNRDVKPLLLKLGVTLALSFAGFFYSRLRTRRIKPSLPPPRSSDKESEVDSRGKTHRKDVRNATRKTHSSSNTTIASENYEETYSKLIGVKEGLLLPEFNDLVKEFDFAAAESGFSPMKNVEAPRICVETPKAFETVEKDDYELEIRHLRDMVRMLREREQNLEVQLLEVYGLKEQETAVAELQNRLKIRSMEAKLFTLKIESLQAEKRRLEGQVTDNVKVVDELEASRAKIRMLKKKLRSEAEQNREQILSLKKRVENLQDNEAAAVSSEIQLKLRRLEGLEGAAEELRTSNLNLQLQNSDLSRRLESTQNLANSVMEDPEAEALKEERERLRRENEDLTKEIEQLRVDRSSDIEELVYLRWINACLRYELRNYQPPAGKTVARDLSKTLSHMSEEKAKQLILEYANTEGLGDKDMQMDFDSGRWSSAASLLTDSGEYDDLSADNSSATKSNTSSKNKLLSKLRRLIRGKDTNHQNQVLSADKTGYSEDNYSRCGSSKTIAAYAGEGQSNLFSSHSSYRGSLDLPRSRTTNEQDFMYMHNVQRHSEFGFSPGYKSVLLSQEDSADSALKDQLDHDLDSAEKSELVKYAEALKSSRSGTPELKPKVHRKSASVS